MSMPVPVDEILREEIGTNEAVEPRRSQPNQLRSRYARFQVKVSRARNR